MTTQQPVPTTTVMPHAIKISVDAGEDLPRAVCSCGWISGKCSDLRDASTRGGWHRILARLGRTFDDSPASAGAFEVGRIDGARDLGAYHAREGMPWLPPDEFSEEERDAYSEGFDLALQKAIARPYLPLGRAQAQLLRGDWRRIVELVALGLLAEESQEQAVATSAAKFRGMLRYCEAILDDIELASTQANVRQLARGASRQIRDAIGGE